MLRPPKIFCPEILGGPLPQKRIFTPILPLYFHSFILFSYFYSKSLANLKFALKSALKVQIKVLLIKHCKALCFTSALHCRALQ